jgi:uncharacterized protein
VLDDNNRMIQVHKAAEETKAENWNSNTFMYFHPGAVKYYREKGFDLPSNLIPPEFKG